jgi:hypothetical protein
MVRAGFYQENEMAWDPTSEFETYSGTRLFITPVRPTDNTETLWEAAPWNEITITSVPNIEGRTYNTATVSVVSTGRDAEKKGSYTYGSTDFGILWLPDQAGQVIARERSLDYEIAGFCVVDQVGGVRYFSGQVATMTEAGGSSNDARTGTITIMRQSDTLIADTPTVPAEDDTP